MNVQQNIDRVKELEEKVKAHCMCANFQDTGSYYLVYYPPGMCLDGAQAAYSCGKAIALERLLDVLERHWKRSGINGE